MNNLTNTSFLLSRPYWLGIYAEIIDRLGTVNNLIQKNNTSLSHHRPRIFDSRADLQITKQSNQAIALCLQLSPDGNSNYLPAGLLVEIIDESNLHCMSARAKDTDDWMQLEFACQQGEQFAIAMELEGVSVVEYFSV